VNSDFRDRVLRIAALEKEIASVHARSQISKLLAGVPGVGKLIATAIVASGERLRFWT
jgi:transposase